MAIWIRLAVVSLAVIFVIGGILEASAKISYPSINFRLQDQPTYCIVSPNIPQSKSENLFDMAKKSVLEWEMKLQAAELNNKPIWDMKYKLVGSASKSCDITIYFKSSVILDDNTMPLGVFFELTKSIEVAFEGLSDGSIYDTILHEIGHSIGLGHFISDDDEINLKWATSNDIAPSIMIPTAHVNPALLIITDVDILKVRDIYGTNGFYAFSPKPIPQPTPTPTPIPVPTPIPTPKPPIVPIFPFESIDITQKIIEVDKYEERQFVKIIGDIAEDVFRKGVPVYLVVKSPDESFQTLKIIPTRKGHFETTLVFDDNSAKGTYKVEASYLEHHDREMDFTFHVVKRGTVIESIIPEFEEPPTAPAPPTAPTSPTPTSKYTPLLTISLFSEGKNYGRSFTIEEGEPFQFAGKLTDRKGNPVRGSVVFIDDRYDSGFQIKISTDQSGTYLFYIGAEHNLKNIDNDRSKRDFIATSQVGSEIVTSEVAKLTIISAKTEIPDWIKNNAKWWAEGTIGDSDFTGGIQHLIKEKIIDIPDLPEQASGIDEEKVPDWIRNNAGWWADGQISDDDFVSGIKYLVEQGIIKV